MSHDAGGDSACVPPHALRGYALLADGERAQATEWSGLADAIAAQPPAVVRLAKEALNGIDPVDVRRSYRFEQGFTFEAHVRGEGDEARRRFLEET